jgi:hypothetical protein
MDAQTGAGQYLASEFDACQYIRIRVVRRRNCMFCACHLGKRVAQVFDRGTTYRR